MTTQTKSQRLAELRNLATEWLDRGCDIDDLRFDGGSTSANKLMRAYIAEASPANIIELLDHMAAQDAALTAAREALEANHQWHQEYDDYGGYAESDIQKTNLRAITIIKKVQS